MLPLLLVERTPILAFTPLSMVDKPIGFDKNRQ
jgi:hypothetical protein